MLGLQLPVDTGEKAETSELLREALGTAPIMAKLRVCSVNYATASLAVNLVHHDLHR